MARAVWPLAALGFAVAGCAEAPPPQELSGLWSAGPAACAAGVGVRFRAGAIEAVYPGETETLFADTTYRVETRTEDAFRVRIEYDMPRLAGSADVLGSHGVLVLARQPNGAIALEQHTLIDGRTGAARVRLTEDPAGTLLSLEPCGAHPWREELRGRVRI